MHGQVAGHLTQDEHGYTFAYTPGYRQSTAPHPVSLTLPLRESPYVEIDEKVVTSMLDRFVRIRPDWHRFIDLSFLSTAMKHDFHALVDGRYAQFDLP